MQLCIQFNFISLSRLETRLFLWKKNATRSRTTWITKTWKNAWREPNYLGIWKLHFGLNLQNLMNTLRCGLCYWLPTDALMVAQLRIKRHLQSNTKGQQRHNMGVEVVGGSRYDSSVCSPQIFTFALGHFLKNLHWYMHSKQSYKEFPGLSSHW